MKYKNLGLTDEQHYLLFEDHEFMVNSISCLKNKIGLNELQIEIFKKMKEYFDYESKRLVSSEAAGESRNKKFAALMKDCYKKFREDLRLLTKMNAYKGYDKQEEETEELATTSTVSGPVIDFHISVN